MDRRKFLLASSQMITGALMASTCPLWMRRALAAASVDQNKYVIYLRSGGGWDSAWWHSPVNPDWLVNGVDYPAGAGKGRFKMGSGSNFAVNFKGSNRADDQISPLLGPDYGWAPSDYKNFTILKGLNKPGEHGQTTRPFQAGSSSPYSQDFAVRAAVGMNPTGIPLPYVSVAGAGFSAKGVETSPLADPVVIDSPATWSTMTTAVASGKLPDFADALKLNAELALSRAHSVATNPVRKTMYDQYGRAIANAGSLQSQGYSKEKQLMLNWRKYFQAMMTNWAKICNDPMTKPFLTYAWWYGNGSFATTCSNAVSKAGADDNFPANLGDVLGSYLIKNALNMAWQLAIAEQTVRLNLSRVVEVSLLGVDPHHISDGGDDKNMTTELLYRSAMFTGWREFMKDLKTTQAPNSTQTIFDKTVGVLFDEFDRTPTLSDQFGGAEHGYTCSAILFGGTFNTDKIFGAVGMGMNAPSFGGFASTASHALPVNLSTGLPDPNGTLLNLNHIFPTICAAAGVAVPLQQITNYSALTALIKG